MRFDRRAAGALAAAAFVLAGGGAALAASGKGNASAELSASGQTVVQGAMVMIN